ncbi:hypothetical protein [Lacticaseibacillus manihotivorans]|uniref:Uncharacterized protein n=2 Tax=Lacticaseibacillus manihotivorans TaxID=88233 RepID=A0A0R1QS64_9LACO|nr:hypothetical protein [Lacticaseibacillus manihotivorans]KRL45061.1 hypothetical protein FD01_GL000850 [Lacticaseibacillus manihotivorans DSM 13343 = JCM 12514]QFQ90955.1 hypothetical protein LM010_05735 [Lacticaseibacillus manihotivorans]
MNHQIQLVATQEVSKPLPRCLAGQGNGFDEDSQLQRPGKFDLTITNAEVVNAFKSETELLNEIQSKYVWHTPRGFLKQLALFEHSAQRADFSRSSSRVINLYLRSFVAMMQGLPVRQWTKVRIEAGVSAICTVLVDDPDSLRLMLKIIGDFLIVMVLDHQLPSKVTIDEVDGVMRQALIEYDQVTDE